MKIKLSDVKCFISLPYDGYSSYGDTSVSLNGKSIQGESPIFKIGDEITIETPCNTFSAIVTALKGEAMYLTGGYDGAFNGLNGRWTGVDLFFWGQISDSLPVNSSTGARTMGELAFLHNFAWRFGEGDVGELAREHIVLLLEIYRGKGGRHWQYIANEVTLDVFSGSRVVREVSEYREGGITEVVYEMMGEQASRHFTRAGAKQWLEKRGKSITIRAIRQCDEWPIEDGALARVFPTFLPDDFRQTL